MNARLRELYRRRALRLLVLVSLLAPLVSPALGVDLWAWRPDHGHASLDAVAPHAHAWDAPHDDARPPADVAFTAGDLLGAPALPVTPITHLVLPPLHQSLVSLPSTAVAAAFAGAPEPPPPR